MTAIPKMGRQRDANCSTFVDMLAMCQAEKGKNASPLQDCLVMRSCQRPLWKTAVEVLTQSHRNSQIFCEMATANMNLICAF